MNSSALTYPSPAPPDVGVVVDLAPGVGWIRMPLPFALDHINLWVLGGAGADIALVDFGVGDGATHAAWDALLAGPLAGKRVVRLIATHFHPDHIGAAGTLRARLGVELSTTTEEWLFARMLWLEDQPDYLANQHAFYHALGLDGPVLDELIERGNTYRPRVDPIPPLLESLHDGDRLTIAGREWTVIVGGGHSPRHVCLHCPQAGILVSGDQVLPRITPIVGVWAQQPDEDPLTDFLATLDRLRAIPDDTLVLPSHGLPFRGLQARIDQIAAHHAERLERISACAAQPLSVAAMMAHLFSRPLDSHQVVFAVGETLAHLSYLHRRGRIRRTRGEDGVWRFGG